MRNGHFTAHSILSIVLIVPQIYHTEIAFTEYPMCIMITKFIVPKASLSNYYKRTKSDDR